MVVKYPLSHFIIYILALAKSGVGYAFSHGTTRDTVESCTNKLNSILFNIHLSLYKPIGAPLQQTQRLLWPLGKLNCPPLALKHTLVYELFDSKCNHKLLNERHVVFSKA